MIPASIAEVADYLGLESGIFPSILPPWEENPHQLLTWWKVKKFDGHIFYALGNGLGRLAQLFVDDRIVGQPVTATDLPEGTLADISATFGKAGLRVSAKLVEELESKFSNLKSSPMTRGEMGAFLDHITQTVRIEMSQSLFMHISAEQAALYNKPELFGKFVNDKFPAIQFDIIEAGNCYAAGRGTAAVFHLMRIMESGVQKFGDKLGVPLAQQKNWQNILDEINKKIKSLPPKDPDTIKMSEISANLYAVKLAWRNEVMHPKDTYTLEESDNLIRQVRIFMEQLATIV